MGRIVLSVAGGYAAPVQTAPVPTHTAPVPVQSAPVPPKAAPAPKASAPAAPAQPAGTAQPAVPAQSAGTAPAQTPAQDQVGSYYTKSTHGDWQLRCLRTQDGKDPCELYQLLRDDQQTPVAEISVVPF